jgi:hypothetical protein
MAQVTNMTAAINSALMLYTNQRKRFSQVPDTLNGKQNDWV